MKKIYYPLFLLFIGFGSLVWAQPTLTSANIAPQVGDNFISHFIDISGITAGNAGANQTWDFSTVVSQNTDTLNYIDPATTPSASSFPNATVAVSLQGVIDYYESTSTSFSRVGGDNNGAQLITYSDGEIQLDFPMTYQTMFTDSFYATINGIIPIFRRGMITAEADGYGTVITPGGTFQNVLRIKYVENYVDELQGTPFAQYNTEIYVWYQVGTHYPVFSMTSISISGQNTTYGGYLDGVSVSSSTPQPVVSNLEVFPNPAQDQVTLRGLKISREAMEISLISATGQLVKHSQIYTGNPGAFQEELILENLPTGIYLLNIKSGDKAQTSRLMIR